PRRLRPAPQTRHLAPSVTGITKFAEEPDFLAATPSAVVVIATPSGPRHRDVTRCPVPTADSSALCSYQAGRQPAYAWTVSRPLLRCPYSRICAEQRLPTSSFEGGPA